MLKAIIFDTETTGLNAPEVIEAAWLELTSLSPLMLGEQFEQRYKPSKPIGIAALARICATILEHICEKLQIDSLEALWEKSEASRIPSHMPFGKHKGLPIAEVPKDYVRWLLGQPDVDPYLRKALTGDR